MTGSIATVVCRISTVAAVYPWEPSGTAYVVTVTVENLGDAGAEVPVILKMEQGQITKRLLGARKIEGHDPY